MYVYKLPHLITSGHLQLVEYRHVPVGRGVHDKGVGEDQGAVLRPEHVHLGRGAQQGDGGHETVTRHLYHVIEKQENESKFFERMFSELVKYKEEHGTTQ